MKCPVCEKNIETSAKKCQHCGFEDLRTEFINETELEMWKKYVVYPCRFAYQTSIAQVQEIEVKIQKELSTIRESNEIQQECSDTTKDKAPTFKKLDLHKKDIWIRKVNITYKNFNECNWYKHTKCEISNILLDFTGNRVTVNFLAQKVYDDKGSCSAQYVGFKWKLKDDYGIVVADGMWLNDKINLDDVIKGSFSISGIDPSIEYVLELIDYN